MQKSNYSFLIIIILILNLISCKQIGIEGSFEPYAIPLKVNINSWGEINLTVEQDVEFPTPLGTASIGIIFDPVGHFNVLNTLTIRLNGDDYFYDLHGNDFTIDFESGYYKEISITKRANDLLLIVESQIEQIEVPTNQLGTPISYETSPSYEIDSSCPGALSSRLNIGAQAEIIIYQLSIRSGPGLSYGQEHVLANGRNVNVLYGPVCSDTAWWWKIYFSGEISTGDLISFEGWIMEADYDTYYLQSR